MIYLDNAATTKPCKEAINALIKYSDIEYYNPSSIYINAIKAAKDINEAKMIILEKLNAVTSHNVIFTSGATEADNLALFQATKYKNKTILVSMGEHSAVFNYAKNLQNCGYNIKFIGLTKDGSVDYNDLENLLIENDVSLVSIMSVNNETGAVNDLLRIYKIIKTKNKDILFHTDAVQGFCKIDLPYNLADLISISSHKIHGIKGTGALVYNSKINIKPIIFGGGQEYGLRSGTENVAGIMAFAEAIKAFKTDIVKLHNIKKNAISLIKKSIKNVLINAEKGSDFILSVSLKGVKAEVVVRKLDDNEILVSSGSACNSKKADNRVLSSMGIIKEYIEGTNRFSFSSETTNEEVIKAINTYIKIVKELQ